MSRFTNWRSQLFRDQSCESTKVRRLLGEQLACEVGRYVHRISIKVSEVDLFVLADSDEQVCKFLNIADLATRFNICFPVPSKRAR